MWPYPPHLWRNNRRELFLPSVSPQRGGGGRNSYKLVSRLDWEQKIKESKCFLLHLLQLLFNYPHNPFKLSNL